MRKHHRSTAIVLATLLAAACETGPVYQPRTPGSTVGYTDLQLSPNRYRVAYTGSWSSTRDDVEMYLLRRASEVALENGYRHFVFQMRATQRMTDYLGSPYPYGPYYYSNWGDSWPTDSYASYAEILLLNDDEAANATDAIDAQRVLVSLNALQPAGSVKTAAGSK